MSSYKDHWSWPEPGAAERSQLTHSWADFTFNRLCEAYGVERATSIARGQDARTNADIAAWNALGRRAAA